MIRNQETPEIPSGVFEYLEELRREMEAACGVSPVTLGDGHSRTATCVRLAREALNHD